MIQIIKLDSIGPYRFSDPLVCSMDYSCTDGNNYQYKISCAELELVAAGKTEAEVKDNLLKKFEALLLVLGTTIDSDLSPKLMIAKTRLGYHIDVLDAIDILDGEYNVA